MIIDNRKGTGSVVLTFTLEQLEYLNYILRLDDWRVDPVKDPIGYSVMSKLKLVKERRL